VELSVIFEPHWVGNCGTLRRETRLVLPRNRQPNVRYANAKRRLSHARYRPNWLALPRIADGGANYSVPAMPAIMNVRGSRKRALLQGIAAPTLRAKTGH